MWSLFGVFKFRNIGHVVKMSTLYRRGGAASLYATESRHFGTRTDPGRLATVKMSTLLIRIAGGD